jgi:hypothetical protein
MVDTVSLPACARLVVMWGDVCSNGAMCSRILDTKRAIGDYFGIAIREDGSNSETYVSDKDQLPTFVTSVLKKMVAGPVALIDLASCGLCRTDWSHVIPLLKHSYETVARRAGRSKAA